MPKKKKRSKNFYFTKVHEEAILQYVSSSDMMEKTYLYEKYIRPAFSEMVDKITYTYKFTNLPNVEILREDCKIWLTTILEKYDINRGSKAFSYFSVITKNWFIQQTKKYSKRQRREISYEQQLHKEIEDTNFIVENKYEVVREQKEYWSYLLCEINTWQKEEEKKKPNSNDIKVVHAIKILLENPDDVEILNKKAIYLYLREITGLTTKQIATSLKKYRIKYKEFKTDWQKGEF